MRGVEDAEHRLADRAHDVLVGDEARHHQRHLGGEPGGDELLDEVDAHAARQEGVERGGLGGADLRQLGGVVELVQLGVDLGRDRAAEAALEAGGGVLARGIVRRDQVGVLVALRFRRSARGLVIALVRPRGGDEMRIAALAGDARRGRVRAM